MIEYFLIYLHCIIYEFWISKVLSFYVVFSRKAQTL